jgi:hypothetical protein
MRTWCVLEISWRLARLFRHRIEHLQAMALTTKRQHHWCPIVKDSHGVNCGNCDSFGEEAIYWRRAQYCFRRRLRRSMVQCHGLMRGKISRTHDGGSQRRRTSGFFLQLFLVPSRACRMSSYMIPSRKEYSGSQTSGFMLAFNGIRQEPGCIVHGIRQEPGCIRQVSLISNFRIYVSIWMLSYIECA